MQLLLPLQLQIDLDVSSLEKRVIFWYTIMMIEKQKNIEGEKSEGHLSKIEKARMIAEKITDPEFRQEMLRYLKEIEEQQTETQSQVSAVLALNRDLEKKLNEEQKKSIIDGLTGLYRKEFLEKKLMSEISEAKRHKRPLSVIMLDIDHFKWINDRLGHPTGDMALKRLGQLLLKNIRAEDCAIRYGGEEFTIVLPDTEGEQAAKVAEKLRKLVEENEEKPKFTISVGYVELSEGHGNWEDLVKNADNALYASKERGRNQVTAYSKDLPIRERPSA